MDWSATLGNNPNRPITQKPVATHQRLKLSNKDKLAIELNGFWSNAQPCAPHYEILKQPTRGKLLGIPPNLTYVTDSHSQGTDHFIYRVNDDLGSSNAASVMIDIAP